jgi:deoxyadenosine/deoxycytidine kinase
MSIESLLVITGSMGAGKTSVMGEASDILRLRNVAHAAVDLDALGIFCLPGVVSTNMLMYRNLESVCKNYAEFKITRLLLAGAFETHAELERCRTAITVRNVIVCRLTATIKTMEQRVRMRETGIAQQNYVARVAQLNAILERARLENFTVNADKRSVTEIANEMLAKAGWIEE